MRDDWRPIAAIRGISRCRLFLRTVSTIFSGSKPNKEAFMNVQRLNQCVENLKRDLGEGLLATSIVSNTDGLAIASHNSSPKAAAIFASITDSINTGLAKGPYPPLGKYYILDLCDNKMLIFLPLGNFQWGVAIDTTKVKLGLLLNVVLPDMVNNFEAAMTE